MSETLTRRPAGPERRAGAQASAGRIPPGLELIPHRTLVEHTVDAWLPLRAGDRARVSPGDAVTLGAPLAERLRVPRIVEVPARFGGRPGERWARTVATGASPGRRDPHPAGELLFESNGRWRIVAAEHHDIVESPLAGIVREVRPGIGLSIRAAGAALGGVLALGDPTHGRLEIATDADGELRPRSLDVGSAGAILVVGARIDAEALTRARAMGIRGIVVATLPGKDRRDFLASEGRQRAGLHRLPPFGVVVLHGSQRRPIGVAAMGLLQRLAGKEVAILGGPPSLVFDPAGVVLEPDPPGTVHVRSGPLAGRSGRWAGLAGPRRFPGGLHLEAGLVRFDDEWPVPIPLADLERLV
jgi:hypothetical protein